jgi:hypothetical protein
MSKSNQDLIKNATTLVKIYKGAGAVHHDHMEQALLTLINETVPLLCEALEHADKLCDERMKRIDRLYCKRCQNTGWLDADGTRTCMECSLGRVIFEREEILERASKLWCSSCRNTGWIDSDGNCGNCELGRVKGEREQFREWLILIRDGRLSHTLAEIIAKLK